MLVAFRFLRDLRDQIWQHGLRPAPFRRTFHPALDDGEGILGVIADKFGGDFKRFVRYIHVLLHGVHHRC